MGNRKFGKIKKTRHKIKGNLGVANNQTDFCTKHGTNEIGNATRYKLTIMNGMPSTRVYTLLQQSGIKAQALEMPENNRIDPTDSRNGVVYITTSAKTSYMTDKLDRLFGGKKGKNRAYQLTEAPEYQTGYRYC